jgi:prolyl oligopeptidase
MSISKRVPTPVEERIHGIVVSDPYRWLEDGQSLETHQWIIDQQHRYDGYFPESEDLALCRVRVR